MIGKSASGYYETAGTTERTMEMGRGSLSALETDRRSEVLAPAYMQTDYVKSYSAETDSIGAAYNDGFSKMVAGGLARPPTDRSDKTRKDWLK
jgi:hypothetical protein